MCLVRRSPDWEDDVVFANRRARPHHHSHSHSRSRVTSTIITEEQQRRYSQHTPSPRHSTTYVTAPRASIPVIRPATPPIEIIHAPTPPPAPVPQPVRLELVSVEEDRTSPRASRSSVGRGRKKRHGGGEREEVYIERVRERERVPAMSAVSTSREEIDTYRYVPGPGKVVGVDDGGRRRSRSITYETNPRSSGRLVERERVVVEDDGRRREYYRRP